MKRCAVVLLAAGRASRYGSPKLLLPFDGTPLIRRMALAALGTGSSLIVVTGAYREEVTAALGGVDARLVHNPDADEGMGTSIGVAGQTLLDETADAAIICPADLPLIGTAQLQRLIDAHAAEPDRIVVSCWDKAQGPPCLFPRPHFAALASLRGPEGARALLSRHRADLRPVDMPEAAADIDTIADYVRLQGVK